MNKEHNSDKSENGLRIGNVMVCCCSTMIHSYNDFHGVKRCLECGKVK